MPACTDDVTHTCLHRRRDSYLHRRRDSYLHRRRDSYCLPPSLVCASSLLPKFEHKMTPVRKDSSHTHITHTHTPGSLQLMHGLLALAKVWMDHVLFHPQLPQRIPQIFCNQRGMCVCANTWLQCIIFHPQISQRFSQIVCMQRGLRPGHACLYVFAGVIRNRNVSDG